MPSFTDMIFNSLIQWNYRTTTALLFTNRAAIKWGTLNNKLHGLGYCMELTLPRWLYISSRYVSTELENKL